MDINRIRFARQLIMDISKNEWNTREDKNRNILELSITVLELSASKKNNIDNLETLMNHSAVLVAKQLLNEWEQKVA